MRLTPWVDPGVRNVNTVSTASAIDEYIITGRKRPNRPILLRPSTKDPAMGSMKASKILVKRKTPPARAPGSPATSV